jgi:hypothetical protein
MAGKPETAPPPRSGRGAAAAAVALFPLLVSAGILAPGWVQVALQGGRATRDAPESALPSPFEHQPLPAPRDAPIQIAAVAVELDRVFFETELRGAGSAPDAFPGGSGPGPSPAEIAQLLSFPRHDTDPIVLDELAPVEQQIVFKDALVPEEVPDVKVLDQSQLFLPLCNTIPATNCIRFDDFTTVRASAVPIPEPGTGTLVGTGLALLALASRRRPR